MTDRQALGNANTPTPTRTRRQQLLARLQAAARRVVTSPTERAAAVESLRQTGRDRLKEAQHLQAWAAAGQIEDGPQVRARVETLREQAQEHFRKAAVLEGNAP